jgi:hypothetical protein
MDDVDRHHPCALTPTTARCTSALGAKLARARLLANSVKWQYFLHGRWVLSAGAPEEIRTPDPQIRSLVLIRSTKLFVLRAVHSPCNPNIFARRLLRFVIYLFISIGFGGRNRARTCDPLIKSQRLKMLGIGPNQQ